MVFVYGCATTVFDDDESFDSIDDAGEGSDTLSKTQPAQTQEEAVKIQSNITDPNELPPPDKPSIQKRARSRRTMINTYPSNNG